MKTKCAGPGSGELPNVRRKSRFSFKVSNGVYSVMTYHGADKADRHIANNRGCTVENVVVGEATAGILRPPGDPRRYKGNAEDVAGGGITGAAFGPLLVVVRDELLDLSSPNLSICESTSWLKFKRIGDVQTTVPTAWHTSATNSWWQRRMASNTAVGLVTITPPAGASSQRTINAYSTTTVRRLQGKKGSQYTDLGKAPFPKVSCRSRFLFTGNACSQTGLEYGVFEPDALPGGNNVGYVVTVSDVACDTAGDVNTCPVTAKTTVCNPVMSAPYEPSYCGSHDGELCPIVHDCAGATGRYVRIRLRGERRIFDANVEVSQFSPMDNVDDANDDDMICWGVQGRPEETLPIPKNEYTISSDPEDPIFYSTCYFKQNDWRWESTGRKQRETSTPWKYEDRCVNCDDHRQKKNSKNYEFPRWHLDPTCRDCDDGLSPLQDFQEHDPLAPPTRAPTSTTTKTQSDSASGDGDGNSTTCDLLNSKKCNESTVCDMIEDKCESVTIGNNPSTDNIITDNIIVVAVGGGLVILLGVIVLVIVVYEKIKYGSNMCYNSRSKRRGSIELVAEPAPELSSKQLEPETEDEKSYRLSRNLDKKQSRANDFYGSNHDLITVNASFRRYSAYVLASGCKPPTVSEKKNIQSESSPMVPPRSSGKYRSMWTLNGSKKRSRERSKNEKSMWKQEIDKDQKKYYYFNAQTCASVWEAPDDFVKCEWQIEMDDVSQKIYYSNEKSGETSWSIDATKEDFLLSTK